MVISSLFLFVSLTLLMVINGYDEITKAKDSEEFRSDISDEHQYTGSPVARNYAWGTFLKHVNDEKAHDKVSDHGDDNISGAKNEIVVTWVDAQNQEDVKALPKMRNWIGIGSNNQHYSGSDAKDTPLETSQENKLKFDGNTNDESHMGSHSRTKLLLKRAVKLSVNNGLWTLSHMLAKTAKNKNKMATVRKPKVVKMKLRSSMLYHLLSRTIGRNNVLLRFWLLKLGR